MRPSSHSDDTNRLEAEIASLRETIARYTEHIEELNAAKDRLEQTIVLKTLEINEVKTKNAQLVINLEEMGKTLERSRVSKEVVHAGVDYDTYSELLVEFGKRSMQIVVLLQEIDRLNHKVG